MSRYYIYVVFDPTITPTVASRTVKAAYMNESDADRHAEDAHGLTGRIHYVERVALT